MTIISMMGTHGHGRREAAEDVAEASGLAPGRHLGADEDDVHAGGGADDEGGEPAPAALRAAGLLLPGRRARAGPHAERARRGPGAPQALDAAAEHGGVAAEAEAGVGGGELGRCQSRHADGQRGGLATCGLLGERQMQF